MAQCSYCGRELREPMGTVSLFGWRLFCDAVCAFRFYELKFKDGKAVRKRGSCG